ncbi:MAG: hypothetical protein NTY20_03620 [Candidatus Aenigmarchaeota archaeon]|jgi:hypothetical protein|nr:hypothetical protein [Candidatus Aenigmarchaeota archaeon]
MEKAPFAFMLAFLLLAGTVLATPIKVGLDVFTKNLNAGEDVRALLTVELDTNESVKRDVVVSYMVEDLARNVIVQKTGTFPVTGSRDILLKLTLPDYMQDGRYVFRAVAETGDSMQEAMGEFLIGEQSDNSFIGVAALATAIIIVLAVALKRRK